MAIILDGTTQATLQKLVPGEHANFGTRNFHIGIINQHQITTIVAIRPVRMAVFGVTPLTVIKDGSTVMFQVCLFRYTAVFTKQTILIFSMRQEMPRSQSQQSWLGLYW